MRESQGGHDGRVRMGLALDQTQGQVHVPVCMNPIPLFTYSHDSLVTLFPFHITDPHPHSSPTTSSSFDLHPIESFRSSWLLLAIGMEPTSYLE